MKIPLLFLAQSKLTRCSGNEMGNAVPEYSPPYSAMPTEFITVRTS